MNGLEVKPLISERRLALMKDEDVVAKPNLVAGLFRSLAKVILFAEASAVLLIEISNLLEDLCLHVHAKAHRSDELRTPLLRSCGHQLRQCLGCKPFWNGI